MDELDHLLQRINGRASFPGVVDDRLGQHNTVVKGVLVNDEGLVLQDLGEKAACVERRKGGGECRREEDGSMRSVDFMARP